MKRLLLLLLACKSKTEPPPPSAPPPPPADAQRADASLDSCVAAVKKLAATPPNHRAKLLIEACHPCGDWQPLLDWNQPAASGGPSRQAIEDAMLACNAYCEPNAKQRFLGTLDGARGQDTRTPWRFLGEICKDKVSAVPDTRFMTAPYFALDRIARALPDPQLVAGVAVPLPAVSVSGVGLILPGAPVTTPEAGPAALTVDAAQVQLGTLPQATLAGDGVHVTGDYPGTPVKLDALAKSLAPLAGKPIAVLAPPVLPAQRLVAVVAAAGTAELRLAAAAQAPVGWTLTGTVPITLGSKPDPKAVKLALGASPDETVKAIKAANRGDLTRAPVAIRVGKDATVAGLATVLGALAYFEVKSATLTAM